MNLRYLLLFVLILIFLSCTNSPNTTSTSGHELSNKIEVDSTKKNKPQTTRIPADVDLKFETFIKYFNKDSLFQTSRIDFPLKVKIIDGKDEQELIINKSDFHKLDFDNKTAANREFDKYEQKIKVNGHKAVIETRGIDNGIFIDVYFEKINGKWKLLTWIDSST